MASMQASSQPCSLASRMSLCTSSELPTRPPRLPYTSSNCKPSALQAATTRCLRVSLSDSDSSGRTRLLFCAKKCCLSTPSSGSSGYSWNGCTENFGHTYIQNTRHAYMELNFQCQLRTARKRQKCLFDASLGGPCLDAAHSQQLTWCSPTQYQFGSDTMST